MLLAHKFLFIILMSDSRLPSGTAEQGEKWEGWQLKIIFSYWKSKKGIKIHCKNRCDYNVGIENTTLKWSEKFLTMAVHCSSNVILLAIEYFIDSKRERQNIKPLSTQNNYSPSFGLKKLVIFVIFRLIKLIKNSAGAGSTKHTAERSEGWPRHGVWSRGKSAPGHNYREN